MGERGALSLFRFHLSPFPPETPDTQARFGGEGLPLSHSGHTVLGHIQLYSSPGIKSRQSTEASAVTSTKCR